MKIEPIRIGKRRVGPGEPCFIIAEAGSNHNGSLEQAFSLIDLAADCGADAVKFQVFKAKNLYPRSAGKIDFETPIFDIIQAMELPADWIPRLAARARSRGIYFLATPFDEEAVDLLAPHVEAFKIASYELTHLPLIRHAGSKGKPLILSTGGATLEEVGETVELVKGLKNVPAALLQCTAAYPAPLKNLNLRAITLLRDTFGLPVGLSDHSREAVIGPVTAVALGACILEKHYTLSNLLPGPDHRFAIEPEELRSLVRAVRQAEASLGSGRKETQPVEAERRAFGYRCIFARRTVARGKRLVPADLQILRCGRHRPGLPPKAWGAVLGKRARRTIEGGTPLYPKDIDN